MAAQGATAVRTEALAWPHWLAVALVAITGVIHVYAGIAEGRAPVALAGVGFAGALVLFFLNYRRRLLYAVGIPYTAVQIPIWLAVKSEYTLVGYVDKAVQVVLILVLAYLYVNASGQPSGDAAPAGD